MTNAQGTKLICTNADGDTFVLVEVEGSKAAASDKQYSLPNGHLVNALPDGTYQISATGEILQPSR